MKRLYSAAILFFVSTLSTQATDQSRCIEKALGTLMEGQTVKTVDLPLSSGPGKVTVSIIEAEFIQEMKTSAKLFRNPKFWEFYEAHPDLAKTQLKRWYSLEGRPDVLKEIEEVAAALGKHQVLLLDPGIAQRTKEFLPFATDFLTKNPPATAFELREAFSSSLGKVTVWRGMLLEPHVLENVRNKGISSNVFRAEEQRMNAQLVHLLLDKSTYSSVSKSPFQDMQARLRGVTNNSVYTSYTKWIEVTHAGAWAPPMTGGQLGSGKFHLFRVEVSPLDLIRPEGIWSDLKQTGMVYRTKGADGAEWGKSASDPDFENFIQWVAPQEIKEIIPYDNLPPTWWSTPQ